MQNYLSNIENAQPLKQADTISDSPPVNQVVSLFNNALTEELSKLDIMTITPLEALNILFKL